MSDSTSKFILPGYVDTHAHYRPLRNVFGHSNPAFLANLAYGVTTGIDVQPSTTDILVYQDMIDAGQMLGPRALRAPGDRLSLTLKPLFQAIEADLTAGKNPWREIIQKYGLDSEPYVSVSVPTTYCCGISRPISAFSKKIFFTCYGLNYKLFNNNSYIQRYFF